MNASCKYVRIVEILIFRKWTKVKGIVILLPKKRNVMLLRIRAEEQIPFPSFWNCIANGDGIKRMKFDCNTLWVFYTVLRCKVILCVKVLFFKVNLFFVTDSFKCFGWGIVTVLGIFSGRFLFFIGIPWFLFGGWVHTRGCPKILFNSVTLNCFRSLLTLHFV